jgi:hypothetical protein
MLRRFGLRGDQIVGCEQQPAVAELGFELSGDRVADRVFDTRWDLHEAGRSWHAVRAGARGLGTLPSRLDLTILDD